MNTIFLVEDDDEIRGIMELVLLDALAGYIVHTAATGLEFLELLKTRRPALILLDMRLPDASGLSLYHILRQDHHLSQVPVLFVTANPELLWRTSLEGPYACLAKPFDLDVLIQQVQTLLGMASPMHALSA